MSKLFKIGVQLVKEKTGNSSSEFDPAYEDACERFDVLKERVKVLISDVTNVLEAFPAVINNGVKVSDAAASAIILTGNEVLPINDQLNQIFTQISNIMNQEPFNHANSIVSESLLRIKKTFEKIEKIREKRRKEQLLCDSALDNLNSSIKKGNKDKIKSNTAKYEECKLKVNKITEKFIKHVDSLSEKQYEIIEEPLIKLTAIGFALLKRSVEKF